MIMYSECRLCPRECKVDRSKNTGYCKMTDKLLAARASLHMWEEPCISGESGSGTVFFSGCNLRCVYCQNREIANDGKGFEITSERLAEIFLEQQARGANNINLVTPTQFVPHIIKALDMVRDKELKIPVLYNCGGYENVETLKMLDGYVDIYLPDFKYMDSQIAKRYSNAEDYPEIAKKAVAEMVRQTEKCVFNKEGILQKGTLVRHLVLPSHTENSRRVIEYLYNTYGDKIYMSIMNQYTPLESVKDYPEINRKLTDSEYDEVLDFAVSIGVENAFVQEGGTVSESFIPIFDGEGIDKIVEK
ncbi:MAG: radical SAM protein [Clostridia bacterium]|nr:radical SAM protein [Clostridia bacterium]